MTGRRRPWYTVLYIQVIIAIVAGIAVGYFFPDAGKALKPLGDGFIQLIKMMIAPVIFCTVVHGIASMGDLKSVGRVGLKALIYFEAVSTLALAIGLLIGKLVQPGAGFAKYAGSRLASETTVCTMRKRLAKRQDFCSMSSGSST